MDISDYDWHQAWGRHVPKEGADHEPKQDIQSSLFGPMQWLDDDGVWGLGFRV